MRFEPVELQSPLGGRVSMTMLRHFNACPRSGFLYAEHRGSAAQNTAMVRGTALHTMLERATNAMLAQEEHWIPPELVKVIVNEVLGEQPVPLEEHDYLRECAHRWATQWELRADEEVVSVERLFVLELAGWQVRCRVDFASRDAENRLYVADYKSGRGALSYDAITRKRPGVDELEPAQTRLAAKTFQLVVYALALAFGRPVTVGGKPCLNCASEPGAPDMCVSCAGTGICRTETLGEPVAKGCPEAMMEYVYPGIETSEGRMLRRTMGVTRLELLEHLESLETLLVRLSRAEKEGDWPAVVSDAGCDECPCMADCPIPEKLRDFHGEINSPEQAAEALQKRHVTLLRMRGVGRELRAYVDKRHGGPLRYGNRVAELVERESTEVRRDDLFAALAEGMPLDEARQRFVRPRVGTLFVERDLSADELMEVSDARGDEGGRGGDRAAASGGAGGAA